MTTKYQEIARAHMANQVGLKRTTDEPAERDMDDSGTSLPERDHFWVLRNQYPDDDPYDDEWRRHHG